MKTNHRSPLLAFWLGLLLLCGSANPLRADQFGLFTYQVIGGTQVIINHYPENAVGDVTIPAQIAGLPVTSIGERAFYQCTSLTSVTIPASVTSIGERAFYQCTRLTSVTIPASVTSIGEVAFYDCTGLTSVTIPASVTSIGAGAFADCTGLTSMTLQPGLATIGDGMFNDCRALTSVTIPASVISIGHEAFSGCRGLTSVTIPASVTSIGHEAFYDCTGLTSVTIPASVNFIGNGAFYDCTGLTSLIIPASVTSIGSSSFRDCTGLTSVTIPTSVTSIDYGAFSGCRALTSVTIPASVTSIGDYAFSYCTGLTSVAIPASVTSIGDEAFGGCTRLKSAVFQGNAPASFGILVFQNTAPGFTVYYFTNRTGFTSPVWQGYPSIGIDPAVWPAATWLQAHGLAYNTNLQQDPDGDGVSLRMAYALNLDPRQNLPSRLPAPVLGEDSLSIRFYAGTPGMTYQVETSRNLTQWTTTGVTLSALDAENKRTASVPRDADDRFLRLVVQ